VKILNFIIVKLTICLIIGICLAYFFGISLQLSLCISVLFICSLFILLLIAKKQFIKTIWFGILSFITTISVGVLAANLHDQKNFNSHYSQILSTKNESLRSIRFRVREVLKSGNYYDKYVIDVLKVDNIHVSGKSLLNVNKDSLNQRLNVDDILITKTAFKNLTRPLNPNQFDYKNYLQKQYIYHQIFAAKTALFKVSIKKYTLFGLAYKLRETINYKFKTWFPQAI